VERAAGFTDEEGRPVAVQGDYSDGLDIERQLEASFSTAFRASLSP
jgi:hypothetical protein